MLEKEIINIILNSPVNQSNRKDLEKMSKIELQDMYDQLEEYEEEFYNNRY